jgi:hypothetical protein
MLVDIIIKSEDLIKEIILDKYYEDEWTLGTSNFKISLKCSSIGRVSTSPYSGEEHNMAYNYIQRGELCAQILL